MEAAAALRVNLSLAWVVTLACLRALIQKEGVFLRTPKSKGSETAQSLRLVWIETSLAAGAAVLAIAVFMKAGFSTLTLTVDSLLLWSVLIYGSATDYALGDPDRPPESLRRKAALQLTDGPVGKVVRPSFLIVGAAAVLVAALLVEAGRAPVVPSEGAIPPGSTASPSPGASATPPPSASPSPTREPSAAPSPTPVPSATPAPSVTPAPSASAAAATTPAPTRSGS